MCFPDCGDKDRMIGGSSSSACGGPADSPCDHACGTGTLPMDEVDIAIRMRDFPDWTRDGDRIRKTFRFNSRDQAIMFIMRAEVDADANDHHGDLSGSHCTWTYSFTTNSAGGKLTFRDFNSAARLNYIARRIESPALA